MHSLLLIPPCMTMLLTIFCLYNNLQTAIKGKFLYIFMGYNFKGVWIDKLNQKAGGWIEWCGLKGADIPP